jgi:hypothetical protein|tara:strand:+ start:475 stop:726 length:252 start_codon:yes stop_codon:yes gene_type:complete
MKIHLYQLHKFQTSKPLVQMGKSVKWIQWDYCDLEGLPPERLPGSMHDMGKIPKGQWDNLPEKFTATNNKEYKIDDISSLRPS